MFQKQEKEKKRKSSHSMFTFTGIQIFSIVVIFALKMNVSLLQRCELILEVKFNTQNKISNMYQEEYAVLGTVESIEDIAPISGGLQTNGS